MTVRQPRLHLKPLITSVVVSTFAIRQLFVLQAVLTKVRPGRRLHVFLWNPQATRTSFWIAIALGFALTTLGELLTWLVLRPIVRNWLSPRVDHSEAHFQLSARESVVDAMPARRRRGRWWWEPGSLVRTNLHLWFFPTAWDSEPTCLDLGDTGQYALTPAPGILWGLIQDLPERLTWITGQGHTEVFAVREPKLVEKWLRSDAARSGSKSATDAA